MCGRFTLTQDVEGFARRLAPRYDPSRFNPRFNICPSQVVIVVLNDGKPELSTGQWGLIPSWAKDPVRLEAGRSYWHADAL
jgi:putative SOS response-associated peptidase YedK